MPTLLLSSSCISSVTNPRGSVSQAEEPPSAILCRKTTQAYQPDNLKKQQQLQQHILGGVLSTSDEVDSFFLFLLSLSMKEREEKEEAISTGTKNSSSWWTAGHCIHSLWKHLPQVKCVSTKRFSKVKISIRSETLTLHFCVFYA